MDTVKKDVEELKSDIGTIKGCIEDTAKFINTLRELNKDRLYMINEKVIEVAIGLDLLRHLIFKDESTEKAFDDKVKELKEQLYEKIAKDFEEERLKAKGEDLQFMSGKH